MNSARQYRLVVVTGRHTDGLERHTSPPRPDLPHRILNREPRFRPAIPLIRVIACVLVLLKLRKDPCHLPLYHSLVVNQGTHVQDVPPLWL